MKQSRFSAVIDCLNVHPENAPENQDELFQWLDDKNSLLDSLVYFQEATTANRADPVKRANYVLENGFKLVGEFRTDLNSPPIWKELVYSYQGYVSSDK